MNTNFCENLLSARKGAGLTQAQLARKIGDKQQNIARWEVGAAFPRADKLSKIAAALNIPLASLFEEGDENREAA